MDAVIISFIQHACDQLMERLKPFQEAAPDAGWEGWVRYCPLHTTRQVTIYYRLFKHT